MELDIQTLKQTLSIGDGQLIRFLHARAKKLCGTEISDIDYIEFRKFKFLDKIKDFEGNIKIVVTEFGDLVYNHLSKMLEKGEIYLFEGKWFIA